MTALGGDEYYNGGHATFEVSVQTYKIALIGQDEYY
jgi:hypothetical protein